MPSVQPSATIHNSCGLCLLLYAGLEAIVADWGLDGVAVWEDVLSAGEQQRLSFARVVYSQPSLVIMDEATSTLDLQNEALCMQRILDEEISILTIAHRPSVVRYHQLMLTMEHDGTFTPTPLVEMCVARALAFLSSLLSLSLALFTLPSV